MREQIIRRLADTRLPADPVSDAQQAISPQTLAAWFQLPLRTAGVLVPLIDRGRGLHVLFTERRHDLPEHPGQISFPGGRSEDGDDDLTQTALREAHEEVGLNPAMVEIAGYLPAQAVITGYAVVPVVGLVQSNFQPVAEEAEVASIFEVPLEFLLDEANGRRDDRERDGVLLETWEYHWEDHHIWGATGHMVRQLIKAVYR
ncbi:MAG: CoA pyrophosphatase [Gammaproteobacteria bacterium]|nr:CoA pyrophosphatase [Gammaproteobacteria bacterium]MCP4090452.1 CoA pyrophosphatase [Gammaproteobacteria bacterium]MCP4275427.1 CoA pyrophosphatase [Gammaproteobacteria bacterium]MCP4832596.1 CoA pyrophosphatase [Gammaproteobacteria bacterium]MCP4928115.1 CoA pyrophosphatase [Gammaproteobacteria bacterium]